MEANPMVWKCTNMKKHKDLSRMSLFIVDLFSNVNRFGHFNIKPRIWDVLSPDFILNLIFFNEMKT